MEKQISLSYLSDELAQVRTKKKEFLARIEQIIPWGEWETMIQAFCYKGERGNKPYRLDLMLHLHILRNLYDLSDEATAAEVIDSRAFSEFCSVESSNQVPDGDTIGRFRNILVKDGLQEKLFAQVVALLFTETAVIWGLKSVRAPLQKTSKVSEFATRLTADHLKARTVPSVPMRKSNAGSARNHLYAPE